jgi:betaine-aldehyde dehydrogenase
LLKKAALVLREHATELALIDSYNTGNPVFEMLNDAISAAENIDFFAGLIPAVQGETTHLSDDTFNYTLREPLGVVARIVASNHPVMFTGSKLAAPLAMGNTVVIKAPEQAPLSSLRVMELIGDIFPPGVLNFLHGGVECGKMLSSHPRVKKITLVGSLATGRAVQKGAADTLKLSTLELGGKNALIAYPDADTEKLVEGIVRGMNFSWCGQSCGSTSRVFLHESLHDKVLAQVVEKVEKRYRPGVPTDPTTSMGCLVNKAAQERVLRYIKIGVEEGAQIATGGKVPQTEDTKGGCFVLPTIFSGVKQSMRVATEEIFGPVMCVLKWADEEEMMQQVNCVEYGLTGAIYTENISKMQEAIRRVEAGTVWVNTVASHYLGSPFGGYKQSGLGREDCFEELVSMTQCKAVHIKV